MSKGLIKHSTLTAIADAIRTKTETTDAILPANMAAMINALGASGELITGTSTPASMTTELSLGVSLPISENYIFVARFTGSTDTKYKYFVIVYIVCINGEKAGGSMYIGQSASRYTSASDMTLSETKLAYAGSQTNEMFYTGTYDWWYVNA